MREKYIKYYDSNCFFAPWVFILDSLFAKSPVQRISLLNRYKDYVRLSGDNRLRQLHKKLNVNLWQSCTEWNSYDYGEGYFYQSFDLIGITGLRDTRKRVEQMGLRDILRGQRTLEIGCNTGFLSLSIADVVPEICGFDINPHLVKIAQLTADHLEKFNTHFFVSSFEEWQIDQEYDAVISFANHSTYDGNTRQSMDDYLYKCYKGLKDNGLFLFESHPVQLEGPIAMESHIEKIGTLFHILKKKVLHYGTFLDSGRTYIVAQKSK